MSLYLNCAGTSAANGIYESIVGGYENPISSYTITLNESTWELKNTSNVVLYQSTVSPLSLWTVVNGTGPAPSSYTYDYTICSTLVVTGSSETNANNGVYNLAYTEDPIPKPFYVNSVNGAYTIEQVSLDQGQREWALLGAGEVVYGSITVLDGTPPIGGLSGPNNGNIDFSSSCGFLDCGPGSNPTGSGFFVYNNGGSFKIRRSGNSFFIRAS